MVMILRIASSRIEGKGILCLLVAIFTSLSLFFCVAYFSFSSISFFEGGCGFEVIDEICCKDNNFIFYKRQNLQILNSCLV